MTDRFRPDNTDGYDTNQLAELNRRFAAAIATREPIPDDMRTSVEDHIAEQVQAEFDHETA